MKISKLFHWLYAILMFLPIMVFIPNAFYYGFNEQAVAQEKTEQVPIYYESNEIVDSTSFNIDKVYTFTDNVVVVTQPTSYYLFTITLMSSYKVGQSGVMQYGNNGHFYITIDNQYFLLDDITFDFRVNTINNDLGVAPSSMFQYFTKCDNLYPTGNTQPIVTNMSITDSMSYAWKSTWENDLFSWSYDSFLTQPFLYITNLFNVPATNTLLYCLSYWLNISIIWLCFDVVMYVPLLVHRWLDKGLVE